MLARSLTWLSPALLLWSLSACGSLGSSSDRAAPDCEECGGGQGGGPENGGAGPTKFGRPPGDLGQGGALEPPDEGGAGGGTSGSANLCDPSSDYGALYLSADDSSSMGSLGLVRELLSLGQFPPPERVRTYELFNFYNLRYEPAGDEPTLRGEVATLEPAPDGSPRYELFLVAHAAHEPRPALDLAVVIDTSGSMAGPGLERTKSGLAALARALSPGDTLSVTAYGESSDVLLDTTTVDAGLDATLEELVLPRLEPSGGSNLSAALAAGYDTLASVGAAAGRVRRVVLFSDGGANVGVTEAELIAAQAEQGDLAGIYLTGVGVGPGPGYDDGLMNLVTDAGRGAYVYLDSVESASALELRFDELMVASLRDVRFELWLPNDLTVEGTSAEEWSNDKEQVRSQYLASGDTLALRVVLAGTPESCEGGHVEGSLSHTDGAVPMAPLPLGVTSPPSEVLRVARLVTRFADAVRAASPTEIVALGDELATIQLVDEGLSAVVSDLASMVDAYRQANDL
jgi:Ca-activated chloride channel family protein